MVVIVRVLLSLECHKSLSHRLLCSVIRKQVVIVFLFMSSLRMSLVIVTLSVVMSLVLS